MAHKRYVIAFILSGILMAAGSAHPSLRATARGLPCTVAQRLTSPRAVLSFVRGDSVLLVGRDGRTSTFLREDNENWYQDPAWSSDGRCLAMTGWYDDYTRSEVGVIRPGIRKALWIEGGRSPVGGAPSWSPDGRRLVLVGYQYAESGGGLYIRGVGAEANFDLTEESQSSGDSSDNYPAWSPDGSRIAFERTSGQVPHLYLIRPNGKGLLQLTQGIGRQASWSPNSKRLAFDNRRDIEVINADGTGLKLLTHLRGANVNPAWSPDGSTIAFTHYPSQNSGKGDIWLIDPDGSHQRVLVKNGTSAAWRPR